MNTTHHIVKVDNSTIHTTYRLQVVMRVQIKILLYCTLVAGYGYIFPPYILKQLVVAFDRNPLIAMEDVFFTGNPTLFLA